MRRLARLDRPCTQDMSDLPTPATLAPGALLDSDHPAVADFARRHGSGRSSRERAVALYYAVRDGFRYDPYRIDLSVAGMRASGVLDIGVGWCVTKAGLLAAAARAAGIPARVGYADVRNHLSTERLRRTMQTDIFVWHGYVELWLDGAWRKCTPAFNIELCDRFGLLHQGRLVAEGTLAELRTRSGCQSLREIFLRWSTSGPLLAQADLGSHPG